ncbi:MAG: hypothetical protein A4E19_02040 [Nitrospira sp. SG-bin1]|nr:MAG: hypothetical protein A4E19_02040 [Nitrospira sp. SG-bin1]
MGPDISQRNAVLRAVTSWKGGSVADIQIDDGVIRILNLEIQDPKAAAVLSAYPQARWAEITRRAVKIGLGYLKGGEKD